jgi:hypothetical protein
VAELLRADLRKLVRPGYILKEIQAKLADEGISVPFSRLEAALEGKEKFSREKVNSLREVEVKSV